jgi:hypothetical protein
MESLAARRIGPEALMSTSPFSPDRYIAPRKRSDILSGKAVAWLTRHGVSLFGSRVLSVPGRTSGKLQQIPVNLLEQGGRRYLVAIRGNTQWVRNVRAAGGAGLQAGRRTEEVTLTELPVEQRVPVLRLYLARWGWEVGQFVEGLSKNSTDAELLAAAPGIPAFEVHPT